MASSNIVSACSTHSIRSLEKAGGIGGLLAMEQPPQIRGSSLEAVYLYDGNGNVGQLVDWTPDATTPPGIWDTLRLAATYEYAPYGGVTASGGDFASDNPFRFSTKLADDETGLSYFG